MVLIRYCVKLCQISTVGNLGPVETCDVNLYKNKIGPKIIKRKL
jgi:hypothetical protein